LIFYIYIYIYIIIFNNNIYIYPNPRLNMANKGTSSLDKTLKMSKKQTQFTSIYLSEKDRKKLNEKMLKDGINPELVSHTQYLKWKTLGVCPFCKKYQV
jgi:hypothetical protein